MITVVSLGVAYLLLPGGHTAHSRFKIPCDLDESTVCKIKRGTMLAELIEITSLIIWDEALMTNRRAFEAIDSSLHDIQSAHNHHLSSVPFGGKVFVLGGDLRQILPVIEGGSRAKVVGAATINSPLWSSVTVLELTENMRLSLLTNDHQKQQEVAAFSAWLLAVGDSTAQCTARQGEAEPSWIKIPHDLLLTTSGDKLSCIVEIVYPHLL